MSDSEGETVKFCFSSLYVFTSVIQFIFFTFGYNLCVFTSLLPSFICLKSPQSLLFNVNLFVLQSQLYPTVPSRPFTLFFSVSNLPLLQCLPFSQSLLSYLSLFHSWLNTFPLHVLCFSLPLISPPLSQSFALLQFATFSFAALFFLCHVISPSLSPSFSCSQWKLLLSPGKRLWKQTNSEDTEPGGERCHQPI